MTARQDRELVILFYWRHLEPEACAEAVRAVAPQARLVDRVAIEAEPALVEGVEIAFGRFPREWLPQARNLKWLHLTSAGTERSCTPEFRAHPVVVTNSHIHPEPISEHLFGMLLMLVRGLDITCRHQQQATWTRDGLDHIDTLPDKTLCILGLGAIGRRCAELGRTFGMRVIGVRSGKEDVPGVDRVFAPDGLHAALAQADVIMNLLPNTAATHKVIGAAAFTAMRRGVYFLNAGRGVTVDTDALVQALRDGKLGGAGLDVVDPEPLPAEHPLWSLPNVIITPHVAGLFPQYEQRALDTFLDNLRRYLAGQPLLNVVDKERGY